MTALAAMHVGAKVLGLDEDTRRALYERVTGKASAKAMTETEREAVVSEMRRLGFKPASNTRQQRPDGRSKLTGKFAAKLQALWIGAWNLGLVENRDDAALIAFVKRQTGIDHVRFVRHPEDAAKAIEALKGWMAREAGVDWKANTVLPPYTQLSGFRIAVAQWRLAIKLETHVDGRFREFSETVAIVTNGRKLGGMIEEADWIPVMNALGKRVRELKKAPPSVSCADISPTRVERGGQS